MNVVFQFEELPLLIEDGFHAGLVGGEANVAIRDHGEWFVEEIYLNGYRKKPDGSYQRRPVEIDNRNSAIYRAIWGELTDGSFKDDVADAVRQAIEEEGERPRSDRAEHSTLHRAYQGV